MRRKRVMLWILSLVLGLLALPAISNAAVEGVPCPAEPTDMFFAYGDLVTCDIDPVGDSDVFRFTGTAGETVSIQATRQSGGDPCVWLYRPDGTYVTGTCNFGSTGITVTLDQTGTYTIYVGEYGFNAVMGYALVLERLAPPSPSARAIQFGELLTDEINPIGDVDIFYFGGNTGETVSIQATRQSGGDPCVWLYRPDGTYVTGTCNFGSTGITVTLDQTGTYTIYVGEYGFNAVMGYALVLQCLGTCVNWTPPDVAGCINQQGSPLADSNVILKQFLEPDQTTTTNANGCYRFDNAVSGKKFRVIIKGPVVP